VTLALVIFFLTLIGKLVIDVRLYLSGKPNKHILGPAIVFVALVACCWAAGWLSAGIWFLGYWILFNGSYAVLIGQKWGYLGTTAFLDRTERKYRWITPAKYAAFAVSIILYIFL